LIQKVAVSSTADHMVTVPEGVQTAAREGVQRAMDKSVPARTFPMEALIGCFIA
jgi:hypothetical protein